MLAKRNEDYLANLYFIFGVLFGGMIEMGYIAIFFSYQFNWSLNETMIAMPIMVGAIGAVTTMIPSRFMPVILLLIWSITEVCLITSGVEILGITYLIVHELLLVLRVKGLSQGASIFKQ